LVYPLDRQALTPRSEGSGLLFVTYLQGGFVMIDESKIEYRIEVEQDFIAVEGNAIASGDDYLDRQYCNEIYKRLDSGDVWAWAAVTVVATYPGINGVEGRDHLGGCTYENESDFRSCGYFADMCNEAKQDLLVKLDAIKSVLCD
jgi:hypothetical protein